MRRIVTLVWVLLGTLLVAATTDPPRHHPMPALDAPDPVRWAAEGAWTALWWSMAHPRPAAVIAGILLLPVLVSWVARKVPRKVQRDGQRMFSAAQRREGFARAGGRCEMEAIPFVRCRRAAAHGDHWFPWTLGGATNMENFVAGCVRCNCSKGAKVPTWFATQRLASRRRRYFPAHLDVRAGDKIATPH